MVVDCKKKAFFAKERLMMSCSFVIVKLVRKVGVTDDVSPWQVSKASLLPTARIIMGSDDGYRDVYSYKGKCDERRPCCDEGSGDIRTMNARLWGLGHGYCRHVAYGSRYHPMPTPYSIASNHLHSPQQEAIAFLACNPSNIYRSLQAHPSQQHCYSPSTPMAQGEVP